MCIGFEKLIDKIRSHYILVPDVPSHPQAGYGQRTKGKQPGSVREARSDMISSSSIKK